MTYRELQAALKNLRNAGYDIQVKLTASFDTLQTEYDRLTAIAAEPVVEMTADEFNEWVGLPADVVEVPDWQKEAITNQHDIEIEVESGTSPMVNLTYSNSLPKNEPYSHQENNQGVVEQEFQFIPVEPRGQYPQTDFESLESLHGGALAITIIDSSNSPHLVDIAELGQIREPVLDTTLENTQKAIQAIVPSQQSSYWIDGTELGQNLNHTQAQALRNLEDGINWLRSLAGKLKAFESGFREGLKNTPVKQQARLKQFNVIPIERSHRLPKPLPIPLVA